MLTVGAEDVGCDFSLGLPPLLYLGCWQGLWLILLVL
jgi:hypothetical protein